MIRRPPRSTLFPLHDALPISEIRPGEASRHFERVLHDELSRARREGRARQLGIQARLQDRKSTRLNSSHGYISYAVFCLKKKKKDTASDARAHHIPRVRLTAH